MPFVKQTALTIRRPRSSVRDRFIGRASELHMFREHMIKPEDPAYYVLSVWGQAGVGKTTLLARLRDEARTADFNDSCLTALVDERFFTPADLMERCAANCAWQALRLLPLSRWRLATSRLCEPQAL